MGSIISVTALIGLLAAWGAGMTFVLLFGDRLSEKLIAQTSELQDAYEQRLQAYRAEIARLTIEMEQSKFDQTSVEGRVVDIGRRQRQLETRLQALRSLSELVLQGMPAGPPTLTPAPGPTPPARGGQAPVLEMPKGSPIRRIGFEGHALAIVEPAQFTVPPTVEADPAQASGVLESFIERMDGSLKRAEQNQTLVLGSLVRVSEARIDRVRSALTLVGLTSDDITRMRGRGEPVLPNIVLPLSEQNSVFAERVGKIRQNFSLLYGSRYVIDTLPIFKPTPPETRFTSGFGIRVHPILGTKRLHAGLDLAAPIGTPVRAAGSGVVQSAGWGGGYGNLIKVDHGNNLLTRYAHLSRIDVAPGQPVAKGMIIGLMGSTGASTGSHLHFETRIGGTPMNPACFLLAGERITGQQSVPFECTTRPVWQRGGLDEEEDDDS